MFQLYVNCAAPAYAVNIKFIVVKMLVDKGYSCNLCLYSMLSVLAAPVGRTQRYITEGDEGDSLLVLGNGFRPGSPMVCPRAQSGSSSSGDEPGGVTTDATALD